MKWGTKWGKNPITNVHSYWGKLKNEVVQVGTFSQGATGSSLDCDTSYIVVPALGSAVNTSLSWTDLSLVVHTVALRNPKFGNSTTLETEAIVRRNRALLVETFRDTLWPTFVTLKYTIEKLSQTDRDNLLAFFALTLGLKITLVDYLNRTWTGFITTEDVTIIQRNVGACNFEVSFNFLGTLS
jgi:hypothetical protein